MSRRSMFIAVAATAVLAVPLTALVTADAVTASGPQVHACATAKGTLTLLSSSGKCARGSHAVTINQQGPKGARGPQGTPGVATAVVGVTSESTPVDVATVSPHGIMPTTATPLTIGTVRAGTYLVSGSVEFGNGSSDHPGFDIGCALDIVTPTPGKDVADTTSIAESDPDATAVVGSITGTLTLHDTVQVKIFCINQQTTSSDTVISGAALTLTPVASVSTTG